MASEILLCEVSEGIATITLNRPESMNAFSVALLEDLRAALKDVEADPAVRTVIITGAGQKAFSAGADLKERRDMTPEQVNAFLATIGQVFTMVEELKQPVIAAVNGFAFGGGLELALAADIRLLADTAVVGLTETRLAIIPGAGGTQRLPRLVGKGKAKELIFTGRRIDAREALEIGLANHVYPQDRLMTESRNMAALIGEGGPVALQQAKIAINKGLDTDLASGLKIETAAYDVLMPTEDRLEGLAAFREKRKPVYKGK